MDKNLRYQLETRLKYLKKNFKKHQKELDSLEEQLGIASECEECDRCKNGAMCDYEGLCVACFQKRINNSVNKKLER